MNIFNVYIYKDVEFFFYLRILHLYNHLHQLKFKYN